MPFVITHAVFVRMCQQGRSAIRSVDSIGWSSASSGHLVVIGFASRAAKQALAAKGGVFFQSEAPDLVLPFYTRVDVRDPGLVWMNKGHQTWKLEISVRKKS
ncbi:MAG: hypothetical protein VX910_01475 [Candidatus Latescibacterota bacterium]|nr:hypothetical protein [Candidatus Latescibacterota bacterium]